MTTDEQTTARVAALAAELRAYFDDELPTLQGIADFARDRELTFGLLPSEDETTGFPIAIALVPLVVRVGSDTLACDVAFDYETLSAYHSGMSSFENLADLLVHLEERAQALSEKLAQLTSRV